MNSNVEMVEDVATYVDFNELFFTPRFAADCFGLTTRRLKDIEESNNIEIRRAVSYTHLTLPTIYAV